MRPGVIPGFFYNVHAVSKEHRRSSQAAFLQKKVTQGQGRRSSKRQTGGRRHPTRSTADQIAGSIVQACICDQLQSSWELRTPCVCMTSTIQTVFYVQQILSYSHMSCLHVMYICCTCVYTLLDLEIHYTYRSSRSESKIYVDLNVY